MRAPPPRCIEAIAAQHEAALRHWSKNDGRLVGRGFQQAKADEATATHRRMLRRVIQSVAAMRMGFASQAAMLRAELDALKAQINLHFLFN